MPPFSTRIEEEGVQINNVLLVDRRVLREAERSLLESGEYRLVTRLRTWLT
jgi:5-oxoprolinase (ATP-hydrolysing)